MLDLYKILNISPVSNEEEIKAAIKTRARKVHPDKKGKIFTSKFQSLMHWQEILLDQVKRKAYDDRLTNYKASQIQDPNWMINLNLGGNGNSSDNVTSEGDSGVDGSVNVIPTRNQSSNRGSGRGREKVVHNVSSDSDSDQDEPEIVEHGPPVGGGSTSSASRSNTSGNPREEEDGTPRENVEDQGK